MTREEVEENLKYLENEEVEEGRAVLRVLLSLEPAKTAWSTTAAKMYALGKMKGWEEK